jgi:small multidrug resistance pump
MNPYLYIALAIAADALGALALKACDGFRAPLPTLLVVLAYGGSFYFLSLAVRTIPVGLANALWSGFSVVMVALVSYVAQRQALHSSAVIGLALICLGTVVVYAGSGTEGIQGG